MQGYNHHPDHGLTSGEWESPAAAITAMARLHFARAHDMLCLLRAHDRADVTAPTSTTASTEREVVNLTNARALGATVSGRGIYTNPHKANPSRETLHP